MAGTGDELGKLFRPIGESGVEEIDPARRMRALSGLASLLRAAEEARGKRRARLNRPADPEEPAPNGPAPRGSAPSGSNVVRLTPPARA